MNTDSKFYQSIGVVALVTALILLIPLTLQLTIGTGVDGQGFNWKPGDFVIMGALLFGTGFTYKFITRKSGETAYRVAVGFALLAGLFLIWSNLAVGLIGSEDRAINLLYFGVIAVGLIGAFIARFQPQGMTIVMFAMAATQALIAVIALIAGMQQLPASSVVEILGVNGFFITLFVVSALLFRYVVQEQSSTNEGSEDLNQ